MLEAALFPTKLSSHYCFIICLFCLLYSIYVPYLNPEPELELECIPVASPAIPVPVSQRLFDGVDH
jgi:hypothetical protein